MSKTSTNEIEEIFDSIALDTLTVSNLAIGTTLQTPRLVGNRFNLPLANGTATFRFPSSGDTTLSSTTFTKTPIVVSGTPFDAGNNELKFPVIGWYVLEIDSRGVTGTSAVNYIRCRIAKVSPFAPGRGLYHRIANNTPAGDPPSGTDRFIFYYKCTSLADRLVVETMRTNNNVTGWFLQGTIARVNSSQ